MSFIRIKKKPVELFRAQYGDWYEGDEPNVEGWYWATPNAEQGDSNGPFESKIMAELNAREFLP